MFTVIASLVGSAYYGVIIWQTALPLLARILLTAVLVFMLFLFHFLVFLGNNEYMKILGTAILLVVNFGIAAITWLCQETKLAVLAVVSGLALVVWTSITVFVLIQKRKKR